MGSWLLDNFPKYGPTLSLLLPKDFIFYSTDCTKFLFVDEKNYRLPNIVEGNEFAKGGVADKAIQTKQVVEIEMDAKVYGKAIRVINVPVFDDEDSNLVVGTIGIGVRRDDAFSLRQIADTYRTGMIEISAAIEEMAASACEINTNEQRLFEEIVSVVDSTKSIVEVLENIRNIAEETKMLGLNAAIEAARAGDVGKGFGVVATEIRKLSEFSKQTTAEIKIIAEQIKGKLQSTQETSRATMNASQEQAAANEEVSASVQQLTALLDRLRDIAYTM